MAQVLIMQLKVPSFVELFEQFARARQSWLSKNASGRDSRAEGFLQQLLRCYPQERERSLLRRALLDPYFPLGMLERTLFADVEGMRFFISKRRSDLELVLAGKLENWSAAFLRIRMDIQRLFDPESITCIPLDGRRHPLPINQWCTFCGICCQIGGVPPEPPPGVRYPVHWSVFLGGGAADNQQMCPFLFQHFGEPRYFCVIHSIKPRACWQFDEADCRQRFSERGLHRDRAIVA